MRRLLDHDPMTGVSSEFESTADGFQVNYTQDVESILEANKAKFNATPMRSEHTASEFWHAADIPIVVQMKWLTEHGVDIYNPDHTPGIIRMLNDPDYRYLKVRNMIL